MRATLRAIAVFGALLFATPSTAYAKGTVQPDERAVVRIWGSGSCTAFLVRPSVFLTAKHCIRRAGPDGAVVPEVDIRFHHDDTRSPTYESMPGVAVRSAPGTYTGDEDIDGHDFGLFESEVPFGEREPGVEPLRMYTGDPSSLVGEEVYLLGFGERKGRFALAHLTSRIHSVGTTIVVDPAVACFGDSGGPLVRASTGEVIGLASREWPTGHDACAAQKGERSIFQRIDAFAWMIDPPRPTVEAAPPEQSAGCALAAPTPSTPSTIGVFGTLALFLLGRARRTARALLRYDA